MASACECGSDVCAARPVSLPVGWDPGFEDSALWREEAAAIEQEVRFFEATLSKVELDAFRSGHRLCRAERDSLLALFTLRRPTRQS